MHARPGSPAPPPGQGRRPGWRRRTLGDKPRRQTGAAPRPAQSGTAPQPGCGGRPARGGHRMTTLETRALLKQLEATVAENLDRHLASADDWMPHEYVPWGEGRNFAVLDGEPWSVEQSKLSPVARTALEVNLLTDDNLPSYHRELERTFGRENAWGVWVNRWTAEEGRHASCIRDYLLVTRGVDPERLERARMATMQAGFDSGSKPLLHACAYVSFQELATRVSHRNTGRY